MKKITKLWVILFAIVMSSCSKDSSLKDHKLLGNYLGTWSSTPIEIESKFSIEYESERDKLVLFYSLADSFDLNVLSDTEFSIDQYEQYGKNNNISGKLVEDTLFLQNEIYLVEDPQNLVELRTGVFVSQ